MLDLIMKFIAVPLLSLQITLAIATVFALVAYVIYQLINTPHNITDESSKS